jgi:hypothetical protein
MRTFIVVIALTFTSTAQAHLPQKIHHPEGNAHAHAEKNLAHALYVCKQGTGRPKRVHCRAIPWLKQRVEATAPVVHVDWVSKQIYAATVIGRESGGDPWPNCPDPFDGDGSWQSTVDCENNGSWYDSPGYFRCGLQFEPFWEKRFGRLCP